MAKEIDKIIQSKTAPKSNNVLWDDGENLKINRNGKWENANASEIKEGSIPLNNSKFQLYQENGGRFFTNENLYNIFDALRNECPDYYWKLEIYGPLESGNTYTFDDLGLTYGNFMGVIYGGMSVAIYTNNDDPITLYNAGESTDRYLVFECEIAQLNVDLVAKTVEFNSWE